MSIDDESRLADILARLASAESQEEEEELGRNELASFLFHASPDLLDEVLKAARRNNRIRRCLSAARYYSGLGKDKCDRIDEVLQAPFPAARRPRR